MRPKVTIIAPEGLPIPPRRGGSVQIYLHALYRELQAADRIELTLVSPGRPLEGSFAAGHLKLPGSKAAYREAVLHHLQQWHPDIVQVDNRPDFVPYVRQAAPRARIVLNLHSLTFLGPRHISHAKARQVLTDADAVVLNSHYLLQAVQDRFALCDEDWHPRVIHPGVDLAHFARPAASGPPPSPFRVLFVGRVIRRKGVHVLIEAIRLLHGQRVPVELTLVGRTPRWEAAYEKKVRAAIRGLPARWVGFVPPDRLPPQFWSAHTLVCPSQESEAFGLVNVEAMAAGLPVIASQQGGIPEVVDETCGVLVARYRDPSSFAVAIRELACDRARWQQLSDGATQRARMFTWAHCANQFIQLYAALCPAAAHADPADADA